MNRITANVSAPFSFARHDCDEPAEPAAPTLRLHAIAPGANVVALLRDRPGASGEVPGTVAILDALGIAALICAPTSQVIFATVAARKLLARGDAIRLAAQPNGGERLATRDHQTTIRLGRAISMAAAGLPPVAAGGCTLAVNRHDDATPLVLAVAPFTTTRESPQALIIVSDPDACDDELARRIQSAFGLTRAETRLALALARGTCRKEFARRVGVQASTVKTQITNLFAKTGTRRESDLVRILTAVPRLAWPGR